MVWRQNLGSFDRPINPEHEQEARLVVQARAGSERAFAALLARYQQPVFRLIFFLVGDEDEARDLTRIALKHSLLHMPRVPSGHSIRPWLLRVATLVALDAIRTRSDSPQALIASLQQQLPPPAAPPRMVDADPNARITGELRAFRIEELAVNGNRAISDAWEELPLDIERELIRRMLAGLPEGDAELLALGVVGQVPTRDLAALVGTSQRSIRRRIARALILFQTRYESIWTTALPPAPTQKELPPAYENALPSIFDAARRSVSGATDRLRRGINSLRAELDPEVAEERLSTLRANEAPSVSLVTAEVAAAPEPSEAATAAAETFILEDEVMPVDPMIEPALAALELEGAFDGADSDVVEAPIAVETPAFAPPSIIYVGPATFAAEPVDFSGPDVPAATPMDVWTMAAPEIAPLDILSAAAVSLPEPVAEPVAAADVPVDDAIELPAVVEATPSEAAPAVVVSVPELTSATQPAPGRVLPRFGPPAAEVIKAPFDASPAAMDAAAMADTSDALPDPAPMPVAQAEPVATFVDEQTVPVESGDAPIETPETAFIPVMEVTGDANLALPVAADVAVEQAIGIAEVNSQQEDLSPVQWSNSDVAAGAAQVGENSDETAATATPAKLQPVLSGDVPPLAVERAAGHTLPKSGKGDTVVVGPNARAEYVARHRPAWVDAADLGGLAGILLPQEPAAEDDEPSDAVPTPSMYRPRQWSMSATRATPSADDNSDDDNDEPEDLADLEAIVEQVNPAVREQPSRTSRPMPRLKRDVVDPQHPW